MGNKTGIHRERRDLSMESGAYTYGYDALGRLTEVTKEGIPLWSYTYDSFGNRQEKTDHQTGSTTACTYNTLDQLIRTAETGQESILERSYVYDRRGNLIGEQEGERFLRRYEYGACNRLTKATGSRGEEALYIYNGLMQRTGKTTAKETESYLLDFTRGYHNLLGIIGKEKNQNFYFDSGVAVMEEKEGLHYYLNDELGSPLRVSGYGKEVEEEHLTGSYLTYGYDEFGKDIGKELLEAGIPSPYAIQGEEQPFGYTGYRYDCIADTYFAQAREYRPEQGRFSAMDVLKGNGIAPQTLNRYGYCLENPLGLVDSDGKNPILTYFKRLINYIYVPYARILYNKQREEVKPPVLPTDPTGLPDYTEEIDAWLLEKTNTFIEERNADIKLNSNRLFPVPCDVVYKEAFLISYFYQQVKTGGEMDIKDKENWKKAFGTERPDAFVYHGEIMDPGELGNITYGYAGAALYPDFMLYYGGGFANMKKEGLGFVFSIFSLPNYGDAPEDIKAIKKGIDMWNNRGECIDE